MVGYSGWGAGQLAAELRAGAWIQTRATWQLLFNTSWKVLWDEAFTVVGTNPKAIAPVSHQYLN